LAKGAWAAISLSLRRTELHADGGGRVTSSSHAKKGRMIDHRAQSLTEAALHRISEDRTEMLPSSQRLAKEKKQMPRLEESDRFATRKGGKETKKGRGLHERKLQTERGFPTAV